MMYPVIYSMLIYSTFIVTVGFSNGPFESVRIPTEHYATAITTKTPYRINSYRQDIGVLFVGECFMQFAFRCGTTVTFFVFFFLRYSNFFLHQRLTRNLLPPLFFPSTFLFRPRSSSRFFSFCSLARFLLFTHFFSLALSMRVNTRQFIRSKLIC